MVNATARKFGHPVSVIAEYDRWLVQLRPAQVTLGSLVLICKDEAQSFAAISAQAFAELAKITRDIEHSLTVFTKYERLNWLMLMMVDRDVHFHIIPRYSGERLFGGISFPDSAWPGPPDLALAIKVEGETAAGLVTALKAIWPVGV
jgi:diadenosine tetraphosphate (Ap4A) HIT family hydrolase